jgi:hypothetical protein
LYSLFFSLDGKETKDPSVAKGLPTARQEKTKLLRYCFRRLAVFSTRPRELEKSLFNRLKGFFNSCFYFI